MIFKSAICESREAFSEYFFSKTQTAILSFGLKQNNSFIARRFSARLPKLHCLYVCSGKFWRIWFRMNKFKFTNTFKNWWNNFSQCCQNCIVHVQTDILRMIYSPKKLILRLNSKNWKEYFWQGGQNCLLLFRRNCRGN